METNVLLRGNALELLREIPDNSIDSVVCDPPYGISFMAKGWDTFKGNQEYAAWCERWARECLRVLKPGGHLLAFSGTRTYHALAWGVESAGFEIRDMVEWLYLSGFPKSMDVGKQFDRQRKEDDEPRRVVCKYLRRHMDEQGIKSRHLVEHFDGCHPRLIDHWAARDTDSQPSTPTWDQWLKLKKVLSLADDMDDEVWRLNGRKGKPSDDWSTREKIGEAVLPDAKHSRLGFVAMTAPDGKARNTIVDITAPATPLAQQWDGWGTALKPAHEPIVMARKPLSGTVCANVEQHGTGAINVDECRIASDEQPKGMVGKGYASMMKTNAEQGYRPTDYYSEQTGFEYVPSEKGRFPANCITTDDDEWYSKYFNVSPQEVSKKASKSDRNSTWDGGSIDIDERVTTDGRKKPIDNPFNRGETLRQNHHPTVKPVELMAWLIRLVTPPSGIVLDPFAGSGTTLVAAKREGFRYIGIEMNDEYAEIANRRTAA